ncbi:hypothetical protein F4677DRAFT_442606 [Hypoxylon crocopeplum]|nr:hypothetical protein F4677DRAFT_442606 [Hypoxylon crocopeplum]
MSFDIAKGSLMRKWDPGMDVPRGIEPRIRMKAEDLRNCPRDGEGTLDNPLVIWAAHLTPEQRDELSVPEFEHEPDLYRAIDANTDIAKTVAVRSGCTVVWIICPVHDSKYVYDENGDRVPTKWDRHGNPVEHLVVKADPHITVRLGTSEDVCVLHGHINVVVDEKGFPTGFMNMFQRRQNGHLTNDDDRSLELFEWADKCDSVQERLRKEAADYELFKTLTTSCDQDWEMEDREGKDPDYEPPDHMEAIHQNNAQYIPRYPEEATKLDPEFEDYIVRRWSPYNEGRCSVSARNFGYNTRRPRYARNWQERHARGV